MKNLLKILFATVALFAVAVIGLIIGIVLVITTCEQSKKPAGLRNTEERSIGGTYQPITKYPFFACIIIKKGHYPFDREQTYLKQNYYLCGSAIIGNYWVITAAHCMIDFSEESQKFTLENGFIRSGTSAWKVSRKRQSHTQDHQLQRIISHNDFHAEEMRNDICLIRVVQPFTGKHARRIPLAGRKYNYKTGNLCTVYGFGFTTKSIEQLQETATERLQGVTVKIINQKVCKKAYTSSINITNANVCAGWPGGGKDACTFDSGGPLVQNNTLIGIVSFGQGCALAEYPGIYTKVAAFQDWIITVQRQINESTRAIFVNMF